MRRLNRLAIVAILLFAGASCSVSSAEDADALKLQVFETRGVESSVPPGGERISQGMKGAATRLRQAGIEVDAAALSASPTPVNLGDILVDFEHAADPCNAPWRDAISDPSAGEVRIIVGGTIRSELIDVFYGAYACPLTEAQCSRPTSLPTGFLLVDSRALPDLDPTTLLLHEIGHIAGLEHADINHPCGSELVGNGAVDNIMNSGLHGSGNMGGVFSAQQIAVLGGGKADD